MKYDREQILINSEIIDFVQFQGKTLSEFIDYFANLRESYNFEFSTNEPIIRIYPYGHDGAYEFVLNVYEDESDETYNARVENLEYIRKTNEEKQLKKERKVYEQLKKKFEK